MVLDKDSSLLALVNTESQTLNESLNLINTISKKHNINFQEISELLLNKEKYISIPVNIFRSSLGPLEVIVQYLKDIGYNFSRIAKLLSRDETTIWTTYHNAIKKGKEDIKEIDLKKLKLRKEELFVPLSIFSLRRLSVLEALCVYLRENFNLSYHDIGILLDRNERTIWTVVNRAKKKLE